MGDFMTGHRQDEVSQGLVLQQVINCSGVSYDTGLNGASERRG